MTFTFADGTAFRRTGQETTTTGIAVPDKDTVSQVGLDHRAQPAKGSAAQIAKFASAHRLYLAAIKGKEHIQPERE